MTTTVTDKVPQHLENYPADDDITIVGLNTEINIHAWFDPTTDRIRIRIAQVPKRKYINAGMSYQACGGKHGCTVSVIPSTLPSVAEGEMYPDIDISTKLLLKREG